jgi:iron uptake system component EfeO
MSIRTLALGAPLLMLTLAACASDSASDEADAADASRTTIVATEYAFEPSEVTVAAGEVTFAIRNEGTEEHEFEILKGDQVIDEVEGLVPGLERDLTVSLDPGDYLIVCRLADHFERGMIADLTVTG